MRKVLLVYDDFNEMTLTQSTLKRLGFDVVGISNEYLLNQQMLEFAPEVVVVAGGTSKVSSLSVSAKLKENKKFNGKVIVILPQGFKMNPTDLLKMRMDRIFEAPVSQTALVEGIASFMEGQQGALLEKLRKVTEGMAAAQAPVPNNQEIITGSASAQKKQEVTGGGGSASPAARRVAKYQKMVEGIPFDSSKTQHVKSLVKEAQQELLKGWSEEELKSQDDLRREFTVELFETAKKAKS